MEIAIQRSLSRPMRLSLLTVLLLMLVEIAAAKPPNITEAEMTLLPRYCPDTMGFKYGDAYSNTSPKAGYWVSLMGKSFWAMHHYCWGLINLGRSRKAGVPAATRRGIQEGVRADFIYVIENSTPDFIMLPEIYSRLGEVELLLGQPGNANESFAKARKQKIDYWPAYSHWAEFLIKVGRRPEALKVVAVGLAYSPGAKVLQEQFRILGGKPSDIPKIPEKQAETNELDAASETATVNPENAVKIETTEK